LCLIDFKLINHCKVQDATANLETEKTNLKDAGQQYAFFQEYRDYFANVIACLKSKTSEIDSCVEEMANLSREKLSKLTARIEVLNLNSCVVVLMTVRSIPMMNLKKPKKVLVCLF
jgi:Mg2+ and Co2+ transporter CorA